MISLSDPITAIPRLGPTMGLRLRRLGIQSVQDLLWYLPQRYEDLSRVSTIAELRPDTTATIRATIELIQNRRSFRRRMVVTEAQLTDGTGTVRAVWFRQPYLATTLPIGTDVYLSGKPTQTLLGYQFTSPVYEKVRREQIHTGHLVPFYRLTNGISHKQLRYYIHEALSRVESIPDGLPSEIIRSEKLMGLTTALTNIHWPQDHAVLQQAIRRLKFEELFWLQLGVAYARRSYEKVPAPALSTKRTEITTFVHALPFTLTTDQKKAAWSILTDMTKPTPMNRLVQGDVGSGKTVVVGIAAFNTALHGYQTVLMAPTEILANQHHQTLHTLFSKDQHVRSHGISLGLLTSKQGILNGKATSTNAVRKATANGSIDVLVGTQSVIQKSVKLKRPGLVIIDEQHRFGVEQRRTLTTLGPDGTAPHLVSLTATPIPRTLALTMYGDLDISTIRQKPAGRKPILTKVVPESKRDAAYDFIRTHIRDKEQVFVLCPLIEESDTSESKSVLTEFERLRDSVFPDLDVRYVHGKLPAPEKRSLLQDFRDRVFPMLVTTSVIEVGIDIPDATIMVIEGAERFGLAQLHQFRGRVGRNDKKSYCFLFTDSTNTETVERLRLMETTNDGFVLAEADLKRRGEGEVFGTKQSGLISFSIATIHDTDLITASKAWVDHILSQDSDLSFLEGIKDHLGPRSPIHWE